MKRREKCHWLGNGLSTKSPWCLLPTSPPSPSPTFPRTASWSRHSPSFCSLAILCCHGLQLTGQRVRPLNFIRGSEVWYQWNNAHLNMIQMNVTHSSQHNQYNQMRYMKYIWWCYFYFGHILCAYLGWLFKEEEKFSFLLQNFKFCSSDLWGLVGWLFWAI